MRVLVPIPTFLFMRYQMKRSILSPAVALASLLVGECFAQPTVVPASQVASELGEVRNVVTVLGLGDEVVIEGTKKWDGFILTANKLVFKPGAKLVFTEQARNARPALVVAVREIVNEDQQQPGRITWERAKNAGAGGDLSGEGGAGSNGGDRSGGTGGAGGDGATGRRGAKGADAPSIIVVCPKAPTHGGIIVDFRGQHGGTGGEGQKGGTGGKGGSGRPASQGAFDCRSGAGNGGRGGKGGNGGKGGTGGNGGEGGTITWVCETDNVSAISNAFAFEIGGGNGGSGGEGGAKGRGGDGGAGGQEARPYCRGNGSTGSRGPNGEGGPQGANGAGGNDGAVLYSQLTSEQLARLLGEE